MSERAEAERQAALYLIRREEPGWAAAEQHALDRWLESAPGHRIAFWRLERSWRRADVLAEAIPPTDVVSQRSRPIFKPLWLAMAAALLLAVAGGAWFAARFLQPQAPLIRFATGQGEHKTIVLADSSEIELNTHSRLSARVDGGERDVWLEEGEAFFQVAHDPAHPFRVHIGDRAVTVLGTKFSIRRDASELTVAVLEGKVSLADPDYGSVLPLRRGQIAVAEGSTTVVRSQAEEQIDDALLWRKGMVHFDDVPLSVAVAEMNRYAVRKIVIEDPAIASVRIGGFFRTDNQEAFLRLLAIAYGWRVRDGKGEVEIYS